MYADTPPAFPNANKFWLDTTDGSLYVQYQDVDSTQWIGVVGGGASIVGREVLGANRTYYVRTDGSDSNDGLTNSSSGAFLTVQKAVDVVAALDTATYSVTIQLASGTYSAVQLKPWVGLGSVSIQGDVTTPSNVVIAATSADAVLGSNSGVWGISGVRLQTTTSGMCILSDIGSVVQYSAVDFGACAGSHNLARNGGIIRVLGSYSISASATSRHIFTSQTGLFVYQSAATVTLTGTPSFDYFVLADRLSAVSCAAIPTFSGSATGVRYSAALNSIIYTGGGGANFFPGNSAGSTATGGQYA